MKTVQEIIKIHGGLDALEKDYIRIENEPWMRLVIEHVGRSPLGYPMVSVAHYGEQNGDPMRDPEMVFFVKKVPNLTAAKKGVLEMVDEWVPFSFQNDYVGTYQETHFVKDGQNYIRPKLIKDLKSFSQMWDRNIKEQGFLDKYLADRKAREEDKHDNQTQA